MTAGDVELAGLSALIQGTNELNSRRLSPLLAEQGGRAINKMDPFRNGAAGAKREPDRAKPQLLVSSAKLFRPENLAELTTYYCFALSRSRFAPVCGAYRGFSTFS